MSKTLTTNAINSFDTMVKQAYQGSSKLRRTVRFKSGVVGSTHRFPKMGKGQATRRVPQTDVVPMNIAHTNATATLEDWAAPEYTDIFDQQKVNYSERQELAEVIAGAIGRREDQLIIDALNASSTTLTVGTDIGGTGTDLNTTKCRRAKRLLDDQGVPEAGRTFVISTNGMESLLGDSDANTFDKNTVRMLVQGEITTWLGFEYIKIETRDEGGLPLSGSARTSFAYHQASTGLAVGIDFRTEVNYIAHKTSWLANGLISAGSVAIDALGIVDVTTTEA